MVMSQQVQQVVIEVSFWAGSDAPEDGKWTVSYDGEMIAKKGTFGNLTIGQDDYGSTSLNGEYQTDYPDIKKYY